MPNKIKLKISGLENGEIIIRTPTPMPQVSYLSKMWICLKSILIFFSKKAIKL